ncbi:uncharacterized protein LOC144052466 [Vanacampus margaritifer]
MHALLQRTSPFMEASGCSTHINQRGAVWTFSPVAHRSHLHCVDCTCSLRCSPVIVCLLRTLSSDPTPRLFDISRSTYVACRWLPSERLKRSVQCVHSASLPSAPGKEEESHRLQRLPHSVRAASLVWTTWILPVDTPLIDNSFQ